MKLELRRKYLKDTYTIGQLYIDGVFFCDTLEDAVRPDGIKINGKTAIPNGAYKVVLTLSNRFGRVLPLLIGVPGFEGVRIHSGNTEHDTEGCILVGKNNIPGLVTHSKDTMNRLMPILEKQTSIEILITNPAAVL